MLHTGLLLPETSLTPPSVPVDQSKGARRHDPPPTLESPGLVSRVMPTAQGAVE